MYPVLEVLVPFESDVIYTCTHIYVYWILYEQNRDISGGLSIALPLHMEKSIHQQR